MSRRAGVALGLAGVLAWAGAAEAECAWVLWQSTEFFPPSGRPSTTWDLQVARPTYAECEAVLTGTYHVLLEHHKMGPERPFVASVRSTRGFIGVTYKTREGEFGGGTHYQLKCLPDTVDPRAPKAR